MRGVLRGGTGLVVQWGIPTWDTWSGSSANTSDKAAHAFVPCVFQKACGRLHERGVASAHRLCAFCATGLKCPGLRSRPIQLYLCLHVAAYMWARTFQFLELLSWVDPA